MTKFATAQADGRGKWALGGSNAARLSGDAMPPVWLVIASTLAFLALLLSFHRVVLQGVQAADMRRQATSAQSSALWRCQTLQLRHARESCMAELAGMANVPPTALVSAYANF